MRIAARQIGIFALIATILVAPPLLKSQDKNFELSKGKAGAIQIGTSVDELYQKVGKENTKLVDAYSEGYFSPVIEIRLGQKDDAKPALIAQVMATFVIGSLTVNDPRYKTSLGIGVGSTLGEIRRWYKVDWIAFGEGPLFARVEEVGMSFALDYSTPPEQWYTTHDPALIPDSARVASVLLTDIDALRSPRRSAH